MGGGGAALFKARAPQMPTIRPLRIDTEHK
jgi:hypothetical protein